VPQRKQAKKELRKSLKKRKENSAIRLQLKKAIKKFKKAIEEKNLNSAKDNLALVYKTLDKAASKNLIHHNKAARNKSKFTKLLNALRSKGSS